MMTFKNGQNRQRYNKDVKNSNFTPVNKEDDVKDKVNI